MPLRELKSMRLTEYVWVVYVDQRKERLLISVLRKWLTVDICDKLYLAIFGIINHYTELCFTWDITQDESQNLSILPWEGRMSWFVQGLLYARQSGNNPRSVERIVLFKGRERWLFQSLANAFCLIVMKLFLDSRLFNACYWTVRHVVSHSYFVYTGYF